MLSDPAIAALRFLVISKRKKLKYLPVIAPDVVFEPPDEEFGEDDTVYPSEAAFRAAFRLLSARRWEQGESLADLLRDLLCVMELVLDASSNAGGLIWWLNKEEHGITALISDVWLVVERLALLTLHGANVEPAQPHIPFLDLVRHAGYRRVRIERRLE